jgi:hypothetical protein
VHDGLLSGTTDDANRTDELVLRARLCGKASAMTARDHLMSDDDGERGERNPTDQDDVEAAAQQAERLERNSTNATDSQGLSSRKDDDDVGRHADVPRGESGDAG